MKSDSFTKIMILGSVVFGAIFFCALFFSNPDQGIVTKLIFFVSLFVFLFSFFSFALFQLKKRASNNEIVHMYVKSSTRQSLLIGLFVILSLFLASLKLLVWWDALLLAFSLILIELYFKSGKVVR